MFAGWELLPGVEFKGYTCRHSNLVRTGNRMQNNFARLLLWSLAAIGLFGFASTIATAQNHQNIVYNATYDCPTRGGYGRLQFRVLSCGANGWCQMWMMNSSP